MFPSLSFFVEKCGLYFAVAAAICLLANQADAQGLIWSLPEDGTEIRYEGTYKQVDSREQAGEANLTMDWIRHLTIKSVGQEMADVDGKSVACRWIELKLITGKPSAEGIDPGPVGTRIYKVLVPEHRVIGNTADKAGIPVSYLPIVKGFKRVGDQQQDPVPIKGKVLYVYPVLTLMRHYKKLESESDQPEDPQVGIGPVSALKVNANIQLESRTDRSIHSAEIWRSNEVPFGLAKWTVTIEREKKFNTEERTEFKPTSKITVEMHAAEVGKNATSELNVP